MLEENNVKARILITDDEQLVRNLLRDILSANYDCIEAGSAEEALMRLQTETFNLVLSDIQMGGISGLEMIPKVLEIAPDAGIIMISGMQNIESALKAMRAGAFDYITKPFDFEHVEAVVKRALENQSLRLTKKLYENHLEEQVTARTNELRLEILERQRAEEKINRLAYYDSLTNLPNPALFRDRFTHELARSGGGKMSATIFLGLDRFKDICDTLGHDVGDEICGILPDDWRAVSGKPTQRHISAAANSQLLANEVGGVDDCAKIAQKIKNTLQLPFECVGQELYITASFGISLTPDDGSDCQTLLKNASTALHRARLNGGNDYQFYTADMHERALKRLSLENSLRRGLEREEFVLHYQPQISAKTKKMTGIEALVRWQHPELGLVSPLDFIPIAEATGLIVPLGEWILQTACTQNAAWQRAGLPPIRVGVNLSLRQFQQSNLVETISRILTVSKLKPQYLELELTESLLMDNTEMTIDMLRRLRTLGIKISIDDFGSGYSRFRI
jgi:predicted signal transduction protein with EAL and GGDEF domain